MMFGDDATGMGMEVEYSPSVPGDGLLELQQTMLSAVWRKRWCVADRGELRVFNSMIPPAPEALPVNRVPLLHGATTAVLMHPCGRGSKRREHGFTLTVESAIGKYNSYTFACSTEENASAWIKAVLGMCAAREGTKIARMSMHKAAQIGDIDLLWKLTKGTLLPLGTSGELLEAAQRDAKAAVDKGHKNFHAREIQVAPLVHPYIIVLGDKVQELKSAVNVGELNAHGLSLLHYSTAEALRLAHVLEDAGHSVAEAMEPEPVREFAAPKMDTLAREEEERMRQHEEEEKRRREIADGPQVTKAKRRLKRWATVEIKELLKLNADPLLPASTAVHGPAAGLSSLQLAQTWCLDGTCRAHNRFCAACRAKKKQGCNEIYAKLMWMKRRLDAWRVSKIEMDKMQQLMDDQDGYMSGANSDSSSGDEDELDHHEHTGRGVSDSDKVVVSDAGRVEGRGARTHTPATPRRLPPLDGVVSGVVADVRATEVGQNIAEQNGANTGKGGEDEGNNEATLHTPRHPQDNTCPNSLLIQPLGHDGVPERVRLKGQNVALGRRVHRGHDWVFGDQDGGEGHSGTVVAYKRGDGVLVAAAHALSHPLSHIQLTGNRQDAVDISTALKRFPYPMAVVRWDKTGTTGVYPIGYHSRFALDITFDEALSPRSVRRLELMPSGGVEV